MKALKIAKEVRADLRNELYINVGEPDKNPYGCPIVMGLAILPDARVIPCEVFAEKLNNDIILGDLKKDNLENIWHSPKARRYREYATISKKKGCSTCPYLNLCGSYCIAEIYLKYGVLPPPPEYFRECRSAWRKILMKDLQ